MGDADQAVIRLRLRKPPHWRWALHTSRSAPVVRVLEDGAGGRGDEGAPAGGVELLVDVAEASERRCSPRVHAILADERRPPSRTASARLRSMAAGSNAVLKQKSDSSLERRAKRTGFGPLAPSREPLRRDRDAPEEKCSDGQCSSITGDRMPRATSDTPDRASNRTDPSGSQKPEPGESKFQSRIARPVVARKKLPDSSCVSSVEESRLPCLRSVGREKSGKLADVTKRYSDSSLGSLSKVMKLRNRLSQSSTGTDTPDTTECVLSDSSLPTVRGLRGSASAAGTYSAESISVTKDPPSRVPVQNKSFSDRSSSVKETKKQYPGTNSLHRKDLSQQVKSNNRNKNDLHEKVQKEVPAQTAVDNVVKNQPATRHTLTRKGRTSDPSKDCSRDPGNIRSEVVRNTSSLRSQTAKAEEPKGVRQPQQRSKTLSEVQSSYQRRLATSRSKDAAAERKQSRVKKQKSDSSLDSAFSSTAAETGGQGKSKIPLGHRKLDTRARSPSRLATGAYGRRTELASARPVGGDAANKPLRPTVIPRLGCSLVKPSGERRRTEEADSGGLSSSVDELDAALSNVPRASSVKREEQRWSGIHTEDMDDSCQDVTIETASCGGNSGSRGRSPECEGMYVAYVVTTPDSEIGAPVYRVDSPSVSTACDVEIVPFDEDLEAEPVFRPARHYFGYGGSFKRISDLDEKDLAADRSERRSSSFGSRPSRPCSNSGSSVGGSVDTNKPGHRDGQYKSRLEKLFRDKEGTTSSGRNVELRRTDQQSRTKAAEEAVLDDAATRKRSCSKHSSIPRIRVSPQKDDAKQAAGRRNPKHSAGLYSYLLKYRPSGEQFSDPEVLAVTTETQAGASRTSHARGDSGVYSLNGSLRDRRKQQLPVPAQQHSQQLQQQHQQKQSNRKRRRRVRQRTARCQGTF
ncbi:uncharacterized protein LOC126364614 isoform X2 [Schistocerca gregaria]|uniref:uncharacterized protein LOC126364614 isoform X2 n=1 Tax=Schistocerca gregaria TaxID=7010 RepID=UPI00211E1CC2|nr:uncharacterized protein LOC126364614 isoform X2 [Schistocerca gregaria]